MRGWNLRLNRGRSSLKELLCDPDCCNIAITLIDLGPGLAGPGHSLPKFLWVVPHLLTAEQEKRDSERDDR
jgi:hypothetical protein